LAEERKRREAEREAAREARRQAMREYMEHNFLQVTFSRNMSAQHPPISRLLPAYTMHLHLALRSLPSNESLSAAQMLGSSLKSAQMHGGSLKSAQMLDSS